MKKIFSSLTCLLITISLSAQTQWLSHTDTAYHFIMQYPTDWEFKLPGTDTRFFLTSVRESPSDKFMENINCMVLSVPVGTKIRDAEGDIKNSLTGKVVDFKIINSWYSTWNGTETFNIEYTGGYKTDTQTIPLHVMQKIGIVRGIAYSFTYTAEESGYNKYLATVMRVLDTFKVY